ncbi:hypothetical protein FE72_15515, partial [Staphylococcus aureus]
CCTGRDAVFLRLPCRADSGRGAGGDACHRRGVFGGRVLRGGGHSGVLVPGGHACRDLDAGGAGHHHDRVVPGRGGA